MEFIEITKPFGDQREWVVCENIECLFENKNTPEYYAKRMMEISHSNQYVEWKGERGGWLTRLIRKSDLCKYIDTLKF